MFHFKKIHQKVKSSAKNPHHHMFFLTCLAILIACICTFFFYGPGWSVIFFTVGAIASMLFPRLFDKAAHSVYKFLHSLSTPSLLLIEAAVIVVAVFVPPAIFCIIGIHGGKNLVKALYATFISAKDSPRRRKKK